MGRGGSQRKRRTGSRRGGSRIRTQTSPPLPSQTKPETPPDDDQSSTTATGEPIEGGQDTPPEEPQRTNATTDPKNENDASSHHAKAEKGDEGAHQEEERDEEDEGGQTLQHGADAPEGGPPRGGRSGEEEEAVPKLGDGEEEEPATPGLPHPSTPAEEHHPRLTEEEEEEDQPKKEEEEKEERRDQEAGEERTEGQQSTATAPPLSPSRTDGDDSDEDGGRTPIAEPMAEQATTEAQIAHADSVPTEPSTTEASDDDAPQRQATDSALASSPRAGEVHASSDEPKEEEETEGADRVQSEPNASEEDQESKKNGTEEKMEEETPSSEHSISPSAADTSDIGGTKEADASHQQPERSKEELVESLLQVMENIVAHRTRHPEGSRSRREHGGPLPPLPSPRSDETAASEQKDQTDHAKNVTTTASPEQKATTTAEVTKATPIAESLTSVLATEEAAGNGEARKRAALMVNRRPRGPLPPTPAQKSKPLPPPPAVTPDQTTDTGSKPPAAEPGTSLPRSYNEDGSVKTFADTITDKTVLEELSAAEQKRQNVITEMVNTERQYVNDLLTLIEVYINPIQEKRILDKKQTTAVFANIDTIYEINSRILKELEERQAQETVVKRIGDLFVREADKFKVYAAYCSSQDPRAKKVKKYQQRIPEFKAFCEQAFMLPRCRLLELDSFLIAPLQRVCKYPLLLKETLKNTPEDHVDHNDLKTALGKVSEIVDRINERTRVVKHVMDLKAIQKKIISDQAQPLSLVERDRRPVREGPLVGLRYQNQKKEKDCKGAAFYAFLLNDLLLLCQPAKESKESRREKGSHGSNPHQQQMYMIKEKIDTEGVSARRVMKADENSPINSPSTSHRKQAKDKLTSLFGGSGSSPASPPLASGSHESVMPVSPQACVPNQFELILNRKNVVKIYRFQTPSKIDTDLWLRDIELAHTERLQTLERQRQQDEEDLHALNAAAAASSPTARGSIGRVSSMGSPFANGSASDSSNRSLAQVFPQRASSTSHVPTRSREGDEPTDAADASSPSSTPRQEDGSASPESPVPDSQADQEGKATPRAFFQKHRRKRSTANEVFVSSPVMPTSPSSTATGQAALSAVTSALAASQAEVKELKLKLQEAERKLRVAELRISDLTTDNAELKKRLSVHERTSSSGSLPTIASSSSEGNLTASTSSSGSRESSPRNSGTVPPQTSGNSKGHVVKRLIPGRRGGN